MIIGVFAFLTGRTLRNRIGRQLKQLRNPRYAIAFLLGGAYLGWVLFGQGSRGGAMPLDRGRVEVIGSLFVLGAVVWAWVFGLERRVLAFSPAEVSFLFPAPIRRRDLIQFKLLRSQLLVLLNSVLWTLILSAEHGASGWLRMLAIWTLLSTLTMHRLGASFVRTTLVEHGVHGVRHRVLSLLLLGGVTIALLWSVAEALPDLAVASHQGIGSVLSALADAMDRPVAATLLWPFRALVRPLAAGDAAEWGRAMLPALALLVLHYVWVVRSDAAFEEAAADASMRRAEQLTARRAGHAVDIDAGARRSLALRAQGPAGWAIVWKNLISVLRTRRVRNVALVVAAGAAGAAILTLVLRSDFGEVIGSLALTWGIALLVIGPQYVRNDLRNDLRKLDLLRTYPLSGTTIVAAEIAASTVVLALLQLALLGVAYIAFLRAASPPSLFGAELSLAARSALLLAAAIAVPALSYTGLLIHNAAALLFPAWVHLGSGRPGGVEALGQNLLTMLAFVVLLGAAAAVPAAAAFAVATALRPGGWWAAVPAALTLALGLATECALALKWLGGVFSRTDVTEAGLEA